MSINQKKMYLAPDVPKKEKKVFACGKWISGMFP